jgi:hypothetical protein
LVSLLGTDTWKRTFVFASNFGKLFRVVDDLTLLYETFIRHLFALFHAQAPQLIQFLPQIERAFLEITSATTKPGSLKVPRKLTQMHAWKSLTDEVQRIGQQLIDFWFDPGGLMQWLTCLLALPLSLSAAFGFTDVIFLLDHFDFSMVQIFPVYPFESSQVVTYISEHLKFVMRNSAYIIAAMDSDILFDSLEAIDEGGINLASSTELVTLFDTVETSKYKESEIIIEFNDGRKTMRIDWDSVGGVPAYVHKWENLNRFIDNVEAADPSSFDVQDKYCLVLAEVEFLLQTIFVDERDLDAEQRVDGLGVENVRRLKGRA